MGSSIKTAGYSGTALIKKLGIKEGSVIILINAPENYSETLGELPADTVFKSRLTVTFDFIQFFAKSTAELQSGFNNLKKHLKPGGALWISWPKKASKIKTDLDENKIREIGLCNGLVDVKVCAVDEKWSGLKFVFRLKDRPGKQGR
jgi:hypothetical protein